eukprot:PhM_4_TR3802/c0_g1_i1/m.40215/K10141/SESN1_3; sestrin 1/3
MFTSEDDSYSSAHASGRASNSNIAAMGHQQHHHHLQQNSPVTSRESVMASLSALCADDREQRAKVLANVLPFLKDTAGSVPLLPVHSQAFTALAYECPYEDVRSAFVQFAPVRPTKPIVSFLDPAVVTVPLSTNDMAVHLLYANVFQQIGFVPNYVRVLASLPAPALAHYDALHLSLYGEGPLPPVWRHYIIAMTASMHKCEYFLRFGVRQFLALGGDHSWLTTGLAAAHPKLQAIGRVLDVLVHQPWDLKADDLTELLRRWTHEELSHAVVIASTITGMCSLVCGCGVALDLSLDVDFPGFPCDYERFYVIPPHVGLRRVDFDVGKRIHHYHLLTEFGWSMQAALILRQYTSPATLIPFLDREFALLEENYTHTEPEHSLYIYVYDLFGLKFDDFNYHDMNKTLGGCYGSLEVVKKVKAFVKRLATAPHTVCREDHNLGLGELMGDMQKLKLMYMMYVSKMQIGLLYFARELVKV